MCIIVCLETSDGPCLSFSPRLSRPDIPEAPLLDHELRTLPHNHTAIHVLQPPPGSQGDVIQALNSNLNLQRFKVLYVTGNYSAILINLDHRFDAQEIRRNFTYFQLMTIQEEAGHSIIIKHDLMLYEDDAKIVRS